MTVLSLTGGLAMDLGTASTLIYRQGSGIVFNEPSLAALESETRRVLAVGQEAGSCLGRTPRGLEVVRPLRYGLISDFAAAREMIIRFLARAGVSRRLFRPRLVVGVPGEATLIEKRAIIEAAREAGCREVHLADETLAAAIGLNIDGPAARMILDVGGGTSKGVIAAHGITAFAESRSLAGDEATKAVVRHIRDRYGLAVGDNTAERIKMAIGSSRPSPSAAGGASTQPFQCRGREISTGIPRVTELAPLGIREALEGVIRELAAMVRRLLSQVPPDLAAGLKELHLTGGGGLLAGLNERLARDTGLMVNIPNAPLLSVVLGLGKILENIPRYKFTLAEEF